MSQTFTAHLFGRSKRGDREEIRIKMMDVSMKQVLVHSSISGIGSGYPPRPANAISVEWIGPDPGVAAMDGDTWDEPQVT